MKFLPGILVLLTCTLAVTAREWESYERIRENGAVGSGDSHYNPGHLGQSNPAKSNVDKVTFVYYPSDECGIPELTIEIDHLHGLNRANLSKHVQYKFIVPGFFESCESSFPQLFVRAYRQRMREYPPEQYQVFCVDWRTYSGVARTDSYLQYIKVCDWLQYDAERKAPDVSDETVKFMRFLHKNDKIGSFENVHLIGNGIGAHICADIADKFWTLNKGTEHVGRITGLDPPGDSICKSFGKLKTLERNDATLVDVYHSDSKIDGSGHGTTKVLGHVDFFPNGGGALKKYDIDYNCKRRDFEVASGIPFEKLLNAIFNLDVIKSRFYCRGQYTTKEICNHNLAYITYAMSIVDDQIIAYNCKNYDQMKHNYCDRNTVLKITFGEHLHRVEWGEQGNYYLRIVPQYNYKGLIFCGEIEIS